MFCNREPGEDEQTDEFFELVKSFSIPLLALSSVAFRRRAGGRVVRKGEPIPQWRLDFDNVVLRLVDPYRVEIGLLAGYMLVFGPRACSVMRLLNLHPAAPGGAAGIWQDLVWQLIAEHAEQSGITIFRAVPEVDTGPALSFCTYSLCGGSIDPLWRDFEGIGVDQLRASQGEELPLFVEIRRRGALREPPLIVETLRAIAEGRASTEGSLSPLDLSATVDAILADTPPDQ